MAKRIAVDQRRCMACKACVIECALAHSPAASVADALADGLVLQPRIHVEAVGEAAIPVQCRHCLDAPCMAVCPKGAISRAGQGTPVLVDDELCIGCGFCVLACPFGAIDKAREGKLVVKCDLCIARTEAGEEPACVSACPTAALKYGEASPTIAAEHCVATLADAMSDPLGQCSMCGQRFAAPKQLARVGEALPDGVLLSDACPRCRRARSAERLAEQGVPTEKP